MATETLLLSGDNSNGSYTGTFGTGSYFYDRLNEASADDTDGIMANGLGTPTVSKFNLANSGIGIGIITSVAVYCRAKYQETGTASSKVKIGVTIGSTDYISEKSLTTSYAEYSYAMSKNPATTKDWTWTNINDLVPNVTPLFSVPDKANNAYTYVSKLWIVVTYNPVYIKVGGVWKVMSRPQIKIGGAWKTVVSQKIKIAGAWK